jgi:hypothetical protein
VRLPRVVASAALIVALAMVVVPASVGSRTPSADRALDPDLLRAVAAPVASGTTTAAYTLDTAYLSDGALDTGDRMVEPAVTFDPPSRGAVGNPAAPVRFVPIATPRPTPRPAQRQAAAPQPPSGGGGSSSGEWRYDPEISWYGPGLYGNGTACGQKYTETILGVAHRSLPCGTMVTFKNGGRVVTVPVIDRGPYVSGRTWDLSRAACVALNHCYTGPIYWRFP